MAGITGKKSELYAQWGLGDAHPELFQYFKMKRATCSPTSKNRRTDRNGDPIDWKLTGKELLTLLEDKGLTRDDLRVGAWNLTRKNDIGDYEVGNVELKRHGENTSEYNKWKDYSCQKGNGHGNKSVVFRGVRYESIKKCSEATGLTRYQLDKEGFNV